ncbi:MAG: alpha/beta fold hydrolase [Candidatus Accumulibacter sp.]|jgi:pimeloyl-ACP methyl ester carboxylesterase|uniref:alpha/beta hydrolase n=1 Tax=unclassified Candidatus Accumulibacter TaxID=2619054 RepID=UPI0012C1DC96|nr:MULTISPECIES: alpha/beta fold hydrolase [unclassified Candidatus Accumulibacter]MQM33261.1 alpha/beta hydrolase [Candidatus Accumulibacter phosphatis]MBL8368991.1 alpha/beta fold hydrolase [Accumulibacter sp.]MBN8513205.1 alpha/beta fold hydrolase [Accumulibacter sp.]MBO3703701.1 alpha/beta fold hydrolase [Accumulibacter sp.]HRI90292.1 alpha/beta fold hydrolase [Accumulibacter sp.]
MDPHRKHRPHKLHTLHRAPSTPSQRPPLLFLHGGYVDARSWDVHFLPYFASHGYDCHALEFSGHGGSDGREYLDALSLDDYLADAQQVVAGFDQRPIVIGHSMGAFIAERLLEQSLAAAAVLLAPVPINGTLESATKLLLKYPKFLCEVVNVTRGRVSATALHMIKEVYFSPTTRPETLLRFAQLVQPESARAVCDLALLGCWRWSPKPPPALPVLVVGGELDTVFPPELIRPLARRWNAELQVVAETGHALILDEHWHDCAAPVLAWLKGLEQGAAATRAGEASALACVA